MRLKINIRIKKLNGSWHTHSTSIFKDKNLLNALVVLYEKYVIPEDKAKISLQITTDICFTCSRDFNSNKTFLETEIIKKIKLCMTSYYYIWRTCFVKIKIQHSHSRTNCALMKSTY